MGFVVVSSRWKRLQESNREAGEERRRGLGEEKGERKAKREDGMRGKERKENRGEEGRGRKERPSLGQENSFPQQAQNCFFPQCRKGHARHHEDRKEG